MFATEAKVLKAQRDFPESTGFEHWRLVQQLNITGVTALDVDIFESKFYWINSVEKVSASVSAAIYGIICMQVQRVPEEEDIYRLDTV